MDGVSVKKIVEKMKLKVLNPEVDIKDRKVTTAEVNRPALQLTGYFDYFEKSRIEIIGMVEYTYIQKLSQEGKSDVYDKFFSHNIPCVIFSQTKNLCVSQRNMIHRFCQQTMEHRLLWQS